MSFPEMEAARHMDEPQCLFRSALLRLGLLYRLDKLSGDQAREAVTEVVFIALGDVADARAVEGEAEGRERPPFGIGSH
ncbi:hypothetical protein [Sinorhizobium medicae]